MHLTHGMTKSPEFGAWDGMRDRCANRLDPNYGGRGIRVCERWQSSFEAFYEDMGPRPSSHHSLDRIDVNGDYEPGNCRWATRKEQCRNTRRSVFVEYLGKRINLKDLAEAAVVPYHTFRERIIAGWSVDEALSKPSRKWRKNAN